MEPPVRCPSDRTDLNGPLHDFMLRKFLRNDNTAKLRNTDPETVPTMEMMCPHIYIGVIVASGRSISCVNVIRQVWRASSVIATLRVTRRVAIWAMSARAAPPPHPHLIPPPRIDLRPPLAVLVAVGRDVGQEPIDRS